MGSKLSFTGFLSAFFALTLLCILLFPAFNTISSVVFSPSHILTENFSELVTHSNLLKGLIHSFILSLGTVLGAFFLGLGLCYIFWRFSFPHKKTLRHFFLYPMLLPPFISAYSFKLIYHLTDGLSLANPIIGYLLLLSAHIFAFYGFFFLTGLQNLKNLDYSLIDAAINLGSTKLKAYLIVMLPHLQRPILKTILIVFLASFGSFAAPLLIQGETPFLSTLIYTRVSSISESGFLALVLFLITLAGMIALLSLLPKNPLNRSTLSLKSVFPQKPLPTVQWTLLIGLLAFIWLPILILLFRSFLSDSSDGAIELTFQHYLSLFTTQEAMAPFIFSLKVALMAAMPNLFFGLAIGLLISLDKKELHQWVIHLNLLPLGIPSVVFGLFYLTSTPAGSSTPQLFVISTAVALPTAYFTKNLPLIIQQVYRGMNAYNTKHVDAAVNLGSSFTSVIGKIIVPLTLSSIATGFVFTFLFAFYEFPMSLMLATKQNQAISVSIFSNVQQQLFGLAAAQSIAVLIFLVAVIWISLRIFKINRFTTGFESL